MVTLDTSLARWRGEAGAIGEVIQRLSRESVCRRRASWGFPHTRRHVPAIPGRPPCNRWSRMVRISSVLLRWLQVSLEKSDGFASLGMPGITSASTLASLNLECWKD